MNLDDLGPPVDGVWGAVEQKVHLRRKVCLRRPHVPDKLYGPLYIGGLRSRNEIDVPGFRLVLALRSNDDRHYPNQLAERSGGRVNLIEVAPG
jgi:hypothetical protein